MLQDLYVNTHIVHHCVLVVVITITLKGMMKFENIGKLCIGYYTYHK